MATALLAALLGGCSFLSKEADATEVSSEAETESPGATQESETETTETEETQESHEAAEDEESGEEETEDHFVEKKIVVATDMHYFAEKLAGNRCDSFVGMARGGDGRVLEYGWEVMDAFLDDMKEEDPDLLILSGDLTLDGEKASHEELAELLEGLSEAGIEVAVIPGNHDINNPDARRYTADGTEKGESITADEFRDIYADFGYVAADSRDPASLSYLYKIDSANWVLMLDSCQYEPKNEVGGMIRRETYEWMEPILDEAEREGARVISVSHHNLLDESGVSRSFYDNCTIEHNEELVRMLSDHGVRLHLSGHLHIQHYKEDEDTGIYEIALVDVLRQLAGIAIYEPVNLFVVHGIDTGFLAFRRCIRFIDYCPVARRSGARLIVGKAVHILCPLCGFFIDRIIFRHSTSFHKSRNFGTNCPKAPAAKMLTASHGNRAGRRNIRLPQKRALKSLVTSGFWVS